MTENVTRLIAFAIAIAHMYGSSDDNNDKANK